MRLSRVSETELLLQLGKQEKRSLLELLKLYPRLPATHQKLSKNSKVSESSQTLLREALQEQHSENKRQLEQLLFSPKRFHETETGVRVSLSPSDLEWLLQVLNDIRVGSWVRLGCPENKLDPLKEETVPDFWAMEISGLFQMQLLGLMNSMGQS